MRQATANARAAGYLMNSGVKNGIRQLYVFAALLHKSSTTGVRLEAVADIGLAYYHMLSIV